MIDFLKSYDLKIDLGRIETNEYLKDFWNTTLRNVTGEILVGSAKYRGLKFLIKARKVQLEGSIHKYYNGGEHNHNDFYVSDVKSIVHELEEKFNIDIHNTQLCNLEIGVNILLSFPVKKVLDNIIAFKGEAFTKIIESKQYYYQCKRKQFIVKVYDKSLQFGLSENILRFEVKVLTMQFLRKKGVEVRYISDLLKPEIYEGMGNVLTEIFDGILFGDDSINENDLNNRESKLYLRGINPYQWKPKKSVGSEWKRLERQEKSFKVLLDKHRKGVDYKALVADLIRKKTIELCNVPVHNENVFKPETVHYLAVEKSVHEIKTVDYLDLNYNINNRQANKEKVKLCSGCGKPIEKNRSYHSLDCYNRKLERNAQSNPKNNFKTSYFNKVNTQPLLFDISDFIKLDENQKSWISK